MDSDNHNNIQHDHGEGYHQPIFLGEGVWVSGIQWAVPSPESYQNRNRIEMEIYIEIKIWKNLKYFAELDTIVGRVNIN